MPELILKQETYDIIGACMDVYNTMGSGFLEAVYQECLALEFQSRHISFTQQQQLPIRYKKVVLSSPYRADFVVFNSILIEIKAVSDLVDAHRSQLLNYLAATELQLGLLVNFGHPEVLQYERLANTELRNPRRLAQISGQKSSS